MANQQPSNKELLFQRIALERKVLKLTKELSTAYTVIKMKDVELYRKGLH